MVRHLIRGVVKHGHFKDFEAATKALNEAGAKVGLPRYRLYGSRWGTFNEFFAEAEYESSAAMDSLMTAVNMDEAANKVYREYLSHIVDGELHDYLLEERDLG